MLLMGSEAASPGYGPWCFWWGKGISGTLDEESFLGQALVPGSPWTVRMEGAYQVESFLWRDLRCWYQQVAWCFWVGRGVSGPSEESIFQVGAFCGRIPFAGTLSHGCVWVVKGDLRPRGEGKHFPWSCSVIRASKCSSLQVLQGSPGVRGTPIWCDGGRAYLSHFLLLSWELGNAGPGSHFFVGRGS